MRRLQAQAAMRRLPAPSCNVLPWPPLQGERGLRWRRSAPCSPGHAALPVHAGLPAPASSLLPRNSAARSLRPLLSVILRDEVPFKLRPALFSPLCAQSAPSLLDRLRLDPQDRGTPSADTNNRPTVRSSTLWRRPKGPGLPETRAGPWHAHAVSQSRTQGTHRSIEFGQAAHPLFRFVGIVRLTAGIKLS